jgi:tetratricopeptide (TPR) repeat protein
VAADELLNSLGRTSDRMPASIRAATLNLHGCCACLSQDLERGTQYFSEALSLAGEDPRLAQNLALTLEWQGQYAQADRHWERYLALVGSKALTPPDSPSYREQLTFEALARLATLHGDKERWASALAYAERAHALRPKDGDTLERLFFLYNELGRPADAHRILKQLRQARPNEPQLDLYELRMLDVRTLDGVDEKVNNIERILRRYPQDGLVETQSLTMVVDLLPVLAQTYAQLSDQLNKVQSQIQHLPSYQINWRAVRDVMNELRGDLQRLRRNAGKCLALLQEEEQRRQLRELMDRIDRRVDQCKARAG